MVRSDLTQQRIDFGGHLVRTLEDRDLRIKMAFWYYYPDFNKWKLFIASPDVRRKGSRFFYQHIQTFLLKQKERVVSLSDIHVLDNNDPFILSMRLALGNVQGIPDVQLDQLIEGAVFYRLHK